jgi:PKD repeat protein
MRKVLIIICSIILLTSCGDEPKADFTWQPQNPKAGEQVQFINNSEDTESYSWNLGNLKISSDENPTNTYDNVGTYVVDLTASKGLKSDMKTATVVVSP